VAQRILVTGASSGLGKAIAEHLAADGHQVFGTSRNVDPQRTARAVIMLAMDINSPESVRAASTDMVAACGGIDVLVNNAGFGICGAFEDCALDEVRGQMETNFFGHVTVMHQVLPHMRAQGSGRIINIGSLAGDIGLPYQAFYAASKAALQRATEALRLELKGSGIDATLVAPGDFNTGFTASRVYARAARTSVRAQKMERVVSQYERDERNGSDPAYAAQLVAQLVGRKTLKPTYTVGRFDQRLGHRLKHLLPGRWFEAMLSATYGI